MKNYLLLGRENLDVEDERVTIFNLTQGTFVGNFMVSYPKINLYPINVYINQFFLSVTSLHTGIKLF